MANLDIKCYLNHSRFPDSPLSWLWLTLYFPFGLLLVFIRFHIILTVYTLSIILPNTPTAKNIYTKGLCGALGILTREHNSSKRDKSTRLLISNNVSTWDHFALHLATGSVTPCKWDFPEMLLAATGLIDYSTFGSVSECTKQILKPNQNTSAASSSHDNSPPLERPGIIAIMPEEVPTNGKALLKFAEWPFNLGENVQPIALTVTRPSICLINSSCVGSTRKWDTFWMIFTPYTTYHINYLDLMSVSGNKDSSIPASVEYSNRVSKSIASDLKIEVTSFTSADVLEYEKRLAADIQRNLQGLRTPSYILPEVQRMANQVREVLPTVPMNVIIYDLHKTKSVDLTLGNILEGRVPYIPEPLDSSPSTSSTSSSSVYKNIKCSPFGASERLSFQQRKEKLIQEARDRYINKHGLNQC